MITKAVPVRADWRVQFAWTSVPFVLGMVIGKWLQYKEDLRMTRFRDKSALYGRVLAPGEKPSWP